MFFFFIAKRVLRSSVVQPVDCRWKRTAVVLLLHQWSVPEGAALGLHSVVGAVVGWEVASISLYATSWTECS